MDSSLGPGPLAALSKPLALGRFSAAHRGHLEHAYATTAHASQGTTAERVLIDAATRNRTMSQEVYYVAISRARKEARVYTDDRLRLPAAVAREHAKHAALDLDRSGRDR
jgi:ATP-dependent exoDNAse (exonuclease V) alpha subunit